MIDKIYIYEDVISKEKQDILESYFSKNKLVWKHINNTDYLESYMPQNVVTSDRITDTTIRSIIAEIEKNALLKIGLNFQTNYRYKVNLLKSEHFSSERNSKDSIHIDRYYPHIAMVYYINDTDGDTKFFKLNGDTSDKFIQYLNNKEYDKFEHFKSVSPKKGKIVIFDGLIPHASTYPTTKDRYVINFNTVVKTVPSSII